MDSCSSGCNLSLKSCIRLCTKFFPPERSVLISTQCLQRLLPEHCKLYFWLEVTGLHRPRLQCCNLGEGRPVNVSFVYSTQNWDLCGVFLPWSTSEGFLFSFCLLSPYLGFIHQDPGFSGRKDDPLLSLLLCFRHLALSSGLCLCHRWNPAVRSAPQLGNKLDLNSHSKISQTYLFLTLRNFLFSF